ncbi:MAG TPA: Gfo/Idh/MocA family oxidoreductase [Chthoniobacterales bacterium]|jgi:predicted dehydrogenase
MTARRKLRVGLIGCGFMGRAHSNAWRQAPCFFDLPAEVERKILCGRDRRAVQSAAKKLGWETSATDWQAVIDDPEIDIIDITTPNDSHCEIALAAAAAGKAILCEKPLASDVAEAERMNKAVRRAGVANMVCHNYRRVPALALAHEMIRRGELGDRIYHFRARYAQDWIADPNFPLVWRLSAEEAGSGSLGDIGSHLVDLGRYLIGEFAEVCALEETFVRQRPLSAKGRRRGKVTVDDAVAVISRFRSGALATLEATRFARGRKNALTIEINGSSGSLFFDLEELNRLQFYREDDASGRRGFRKILVTEREHPYLEHWWPPGHLLGYEHSFVHTIADFVRAVVAGRSVSPTFADGLANQRVLAAIAESAQRRSWIQL